MKKIACLILAVLFTVLGMVTASAASRQDVIDYAKETIPSKYITYHVWAENILGQYDLSEEEWDEVLSLLEDLVASFPSDKGQSLHTYESSQRAAAMQALNAFCDITGSTFVLRNVASPKHTGDQEVLLYKEDGTLVAVIDGDLYPDTTGLSADSTLLIVAVSCLVLAGVSAVVLRRRIFTA